MTTEAMSVKEYHSRFHRKPSRAKPRQLESHLQQQEITWFRLQYPDYTELLISIPNEAKRTAINGARMKAQGMRKGSLDMVLCVARHGYHGLWIENKIAPNKLTVEQIVMVSKLRQQQYAVIICYTLEEFQSAVNDYLK